MLTFGLNEKQFYLGQYINLQNLKISENPNAGKLKKYHVQRDKKVPKSISQLRFTVDQISKKSMFDDLSRIFNISKHHIFCLIANGKLNWLIQQLIKEKNLLLYFYYTEKSAQAITENKQESMIIRIDYGFDCFAIADVGYEMELKRFKEVYLYLYKIRTVCPFFSI
jgi:hypothetical protein